MKFFDSHVHLHNEKLTGGEKDEEFIFNNVSISLDEFRVCLKQSLDNKHVYLTAGVHPLEIDNVELSIAMAELDSCIAKHRDKVIAIGETGLDFYKALKNEVFEKQQRGFFAHYELAKKYKLPLMLHIRRAHEDALDLLEGIIDGYGVIHAYDASEEITERYLKLSGNWMLSVSPVVFRDTSLFRDQISKVDINRLLVESDAPYLGKSYLDVKKIIALIAEAKNINFDECKEILGNNFCRFFKLNIQ